LFTCAAFAPHPVACHEPAPPRQKAGRSLQAIPSPARRFADHPCRLPAPCPAGRERCVAPTSATNSRHQHPLGCPIPERASGPVPLRARTLSRRPALGQRPPADPRVELRLTANLQLRHGVQCVRPASGAEAPSAGVTRRGAVLAEPRSKAPPPCVPRPRRSLPRAGSITLASDVLCRRPTRARPDLAVDPNPGEPPGSLPPPSRQRRAASSNQDAFPRRVLTPPHRLFRVRG